MKITVDVPEADEAVIETALGDELPPGPSLGIRLEEYFARQVEQALRRQIHTERVQAAVTEATDEPLPVGVDRDSVTEWEPNIAVVVDEVVIYGGLYYRVIQAHTTQADWTPPETPALFEAL